MIESMVTFWLLAGIVLMLSEVILPGLIAVFLGMGALTVAGLLHYQIIESLPVQWSSWFIISTVYIFSLRILVMRYYPSDRAATSIDEDQAVIGKTAIVVKAIPAHEVIKAFGRIQFGETTWQASTESKDAIPEGIWVRVVRRDNISWVVEPVTSNDSDNAR